MAKQSIASDLMLPPRSRGETPSHWLREGIRRGILEGQLPSGTRLPSSRGIARLHGVARGTVVLVMDQLRLEGYLECMQGSGTYVSRALPDDMLRVSDRSRGRSPQPHAETQQAAHKDFAVSRYARRVKPFSYFIEPKSVAFRTNLPALDLFPTTLWAQVVSRRIRAAPTHLLLGCPASGYPPLRASIAEHLRTARGVVCDPEQIVVTSGVQEGVELAARLLLNPGDTVLAEDPGFQGAYAAFAAVGARVVPTGLDAEGFLPKPQDLRRARLIYVTPTHQFPTGVTMSLKRRMELLRWARAADAILFEDDYDSDFCYSGRPVPAILALDRHGSTILAGSFNKSMFPSLRLGYLVLPARLVETFTGAKAISTRQQPLLEQAAMHDFLAQGYYGAHVRRMRRIYAERLQCLVHHIHESLGEQLTLSSMEAGLQIMALLADGLCAEDVARTLAGRRVDVVPLCRYVHAQEHAAEALQIGFAAVDENSIRAGVQTLGLVLAEAKKHGAGPSPRMDQAAASNRTR
jgi:GntR family transcriptional regulator/MocR family aminotransferase